MYRRPVIGAVVVGAAVLLGACINFDPPQVAPASGDATARSRDVVLVDVTGDGVDDPVVLTTADVLTWLAPCGTGCWERREEIELTEPSRITAAEFDGDGAADVVVTLGSGVRVYWGGAASGSRPAGLVATDASDIDATTIGGTPAVGDVNGDGALDVAVIGTDPGQFVYRYVDMLGNGAGGFAPAVERFEAPQQGAVRGPATGDIDGDGDDEVLAAFTRINGVSFIRIFGDDLDDTGIAAVGAYVDALATGDLNGDSLDDVVARERPPGAEVRFNLLRSNGQWLVGFGPVEEEPTLLPSGATTAGDFVVQDLDGDGRTDLLASDGVSRISWWHGNGDGTFVEVNGQSRVDRAAGPGANALATGLLAGDTRPDLLVANSTAPNAQVTILPNASVLP